MLLGRKAMTNLKTALKSKDITLPTKVHIVKPMYSSHVQMWELDDKEGRALKNWCFQIVVLEKILESPLESKEIKPVNPKENQPWIFTGSSDAEAEAPILWLPDLNQLTHWKRPWCWERLKAEREEGNRGWDGWMASLIQWTWTWANSGTWWGTGKPGVLQSMGSPRVGHDLATEQQENKTDNWKEWAAPSKGSYQEEKSREAST